MVLLLSDLHLGRGTPAATRAAERDAVACLRAHERGVLDGGALVLVGDVFDAFIEYRHLMPKRGLRLLGLLADWADRGGAVHYAVGNRDPWHGGLLEREVGATLHREPWEAVLGGVRAYIAHGDRDMPSRALSPRALAHRLTPLLRSPRMARLYRMAFPGDAGFAFATWAARRFGSDGAADPADSAALEAAARARLRTTDAELVVHGHVHEAALVRTADGAYLNPGYWFGDRTFARLDADGPSLWRWADAAAHPLAPAAASRSTRPAPAAPSL